MKQRTKQLNKTEIQFTGPANLGREIQNRTLSTNDKFRAILSALADPEIDGRGPTAPFVIQCHKRRFGDSSNEVDHMSEGDGEMNMTGRMDRSALSQS